MEPATSELAMKALTLVGVVISSAAMSVSGLPLALRLRLFAVSLCGVVLMFANAAIASAPYALALDASYACLAVGLVASGALAFRVAGRPMVPKVGVAFVEARPPDLPIGRIQPPRPAARFQPSPILPMAAVGQSLPRPNHLKALTGVGPEGSQPANPPWGPAAVVLARAPKRAIVDRDDPRRAPSGSRKE